LTITTGVIKSPTTGRQLIAVSSRENPLGCPNLAGHKGEDATKARQGFGLF
jgi:hypothetical protein